MNDTKNRVNKSIHPSKWLPYFKKLLTPRQFKGENIKNTEKLKTYYKRKKSLYINQWDHLTKYLAKKKS